jgi:phosphoglycolate phosphatase-like HAD superfamily hydrolase
MNVSILRKAKLIFWDFDGVIKETSEVKSDGFRSLFLDFGKNFSQRVYEHHLENQGISRREKIALYLSWSGVLVTESLLNEYCKKFSNLVFDAVLNAPWVPGVHNYIVNNFESQKFIIISATPVEELHRILKALNFESYFVGIYGYPPKKSNTIKKSLKEIYISASDAIFIGDAEADFDAATENNIQFILRRTLSESSFQKTYEGLSFSDLAL